MKQLFSNWIIILWGCMFGCSSNGQDLRQAKMNCYADKLKEIKALSLYKEVMNQFVDTFKLMKNDKRYFGVPEVVTNKIDEAIFFKENKTECLLIVLKRNIYDLIFGNARIVRGTLQGEKWVFKPSIEYFFEKSYFNLYPENSFENISKLARYDVLTDGEVKKNGCEIDENYWFAHLKQ